jgi:hypothetical protein
MTSLMPELGGWGGYRLHPLDHLFRACQYNRAGLLHASSVRLFLMFDLDQTLHHRPLTLHGFLLFQEKGPEAAACP